MSIAQESLRLTGLFEAELLVELMLRYWNHPLRDVRTFRNDILENAAELLRVAVGGTRVLEGVAPENLNLIAAIWCAENTAVSDLRDAEPEELQKRQAWLDVVQRAVPSCFCNPEMLD
jgi:hypothetical protein